MKHRFALSTAGLCVLCWFGIGCRPSDCTPRMLVVLDANDVPPEEGFVLMATSSGMNAPTAPLSWEFSRDTLYWDRSTGLVSVPSSLPRNTWLHVQSPDPVSTGQWRTMWRKAEDMDTVRLAVTVPYQLHARLHRSIGGIPSRYSVECVSAKDGSLTVESWEQVEGSVRRYGHTTVSSFPFHFRLRRYIPSTGEERIVAQTEVEFQGAETAIVGNCMDVDQLEQLP